MTNKQKIQVAIMWSAALIYNCGMDSFDDSAVSYDDQTDICEFMEAIAKTLLSEKKAPLLNTLPDIIEYCTNK